MLPGVTKIRLMFYFPVNRPGEPYKQYRPEEVIDEDFDIFA